MPVINQQRRMVWSAEQMFDLVADVKRYPEFLPWVVATRIQSDSETIMVADMMVGFSALREKFTSRVSKQRPGRIAVEYLDGPLKHLSNTWDFAAAEDGGCVIDFCVDFTFRSSIFEALADQCGAGLLRLKGIVAIAERPEQPVVIHGVQHLFHAPIWLDRWPSADRTTRMVLIGRDLSGPWAELLLDAIEAEVGEVSSGRTGETAFHFPMQTSGAMRAG